LLPGKDRPTPGGIEFASSVSAFLTLNDEERMSNSFAK
jgi:hypothetical protein